MAEVFNHDFIERQLRSFHRWHPQSDLLKASEALREAIGLLVLLRMECEPKEGLSVETAAQFDRFMQEHNVRIDFLEPRLK